MPCIEYRKAGKETTERAVLPVPQLLFPVYADQKQTEAKKMAEKEGFITIFLPFYKILQTLHSSKAGFAVL